MSRPRLISALCLAAALWHRAAVAEIPAATQCDLPADLVAPEHPLPRIVPRLQPGGRLDVLALGSGSLLGLRGGVEGSVPAYMVEALRAAVPGATIRLTIWGARAATAAEMDAALRKALAAHPYQLVIWQTGTVEAVRKEAPADFDKTLRDGAAAVEGAQASLLLIDVPFSRLLESNSDLQPYRDVLARLADLGHVTLFRRYDLMRHWADSGEIDLEAAGKNERNRTAVRLRACLGQALAKLLLAERRS